MATIAEYSLAGLSDFDVGRYVETAELTFKENSKWGLAVTPRMRKAQRRSRSFTFSTPAGIAIAITSASTIGDDKTAITPTEAQYTCTAATYKNRVRIDQMSEGASVVELLDSSLAQFAQSAAMTFDYQCATAALAAAITASKGHASDPGSTIADYSATVAGDVMTLSDARRAHAELTKASAPMISVPGYGMVYLAMVHPDVAYDLKDASSSSIFEGASGVNAPNYIGNVLGVAAGFLWVESGSAALIEANAGAGNVDAYKTMFLGADAIGMGEVPVAKTKTADDFPLNWLADPQGGEDLGPSMVCRISYPGSNLGEVKEVGLLMNVGFQLVHPECSWVCVSASSLGANT